MSHLPPSLARLLTSLCVLAGLAGPVAANDAWTDLGAALAGTHGAPTLVGTGPLVAGTPVSLTAAGLRAQSTAFLVIGLSQIDAPFFGGTFVPAPDLVLALPTGGSVGVPAALVLADDWPAGVPHGTDIAFQVWVEDPAAPFGYAGSNALRGSAAQVYDLIADPFDALLAAAQPPAVSKRLYTTQDFGTQTFVRNPDCWAASLDLTGISPWNQAHANTRAGTLVSPRHVVFAQHYPLSTTPGNNAIAFVTADDVTVIRHVVAVTYPAVDIGVGLLDADVPAEIGFHSVLPTDWADHMWETLRLPMLHLDQEEKALVRDMLTLTPTSTYVNHTGPSLMLRSQFAEVLISGDSGNPAFLVIDGQAVLMLTHHFATSGPFYTRWFTQVNAAMTTLGGGHQLTEFDLDGWLAR